MIRLDEAVRTVKLVQDAQPKLAKLRESVRDVEAVFLKDMLSAMRRALPKSSLVQSAGADLFRDLMDGEVAKAASRRSDLGIGRTLYQTLSKQLLNQERVAQRSRKTDLAA
jgi:Rod binding domain-containing protein